jgi:hypothetical protein
MTHVKMRIIHWLASAIFMMASGSVSACYKFDPMSGALSGGTAPEPLAKVATENTLHRPGDDRQSLTGCDGSGWETIISGMYWNDVAARLDRVDVTGNRHRNEYEICHRDACSGIVAGWQAATTRLLSLGYAGAASEVMAKSGVAKAPETCGGSKRTTDVTANTESGVRASEFRFLMGQLDRIEPACMRLNGRTGP